MIFYIFQNFKPFQKLELESFPHQAEDSDTFDIENENGNINRQPPITVQDSESEEASSSDHSEK